MKNPVNAFLCAALFYLGCQPAQPAKTAVDTAPPDSDTMMVWIPAGTFIMGAARQSNTHDAQPRHEVHVNGFWIDACEVTNAEYAAFVKATGYVTLAERPVQWEELQKLLPPGTPRPPEDKMQPGSMVFTAPDHAVSLNDYSLWWKWTTGANWKHPEGPSSEITGKDRFPVVQLAYADCEAYAKWAGKRMPTEAEWEYAARGGLPAREFGWGDELTPGGKYMANFFQGHFPYQNSSSDGYAGAAPVRSFPPNGYGLYDMVGNVWELCSDWYDTEDFEHSCHSGTELNPHGPAKTHDANDPYAIKHVSKGGSFLCSDEYCSNYKPSGRQGSSYDTGMNHTGFRCVRDGRGAVGSRQ